jgi:CrcB protein
VSALLWFGVLVCGGAGALGRFLIDGAISAAVQRELPVGTFAINVSGAGLLGLLTGLALHGAALTLAGTAVLGSYTTFSTWMLETHRLRDEGAFTRAVGNAVISLLVGLGAAALGRYVGAHV